MREAYKLKVSVLFKIGVSLLFLEILINKAGTLGLWSEFKKTSLLYICSILVVGVLRQFIRGWRWKYVLTHAGQIQTTLFTTTKLYFVAIFVSNFAPGVNTGDLIRPMGLKNLNAEQKKFTYATVVYERFLGFFSVILLAIIGAVFFATKHDFLYLYILISIILITGFTILFYNYFRQSQIFQIGVLEQFFSVLNYLFNQIGCMLRQREMTIIVIITSIAFNFIAIVIYWLNSIALHADISFFVFFLAAPLGWLIAIIPVSFNGLGLREGVMCFVLKDFGVPLETSLAIVLLFLPIQIFCSIIGAWFFITTRLKIKH